MIASSWLKYIVLCKIGIGINRKEKEWNYDKMKKIVKKVLV